MTLSERAATPGDRPGAAEGRARADAQPLFSIGEVLAELRAEFPDTTISKLRFLESEGLVEPQRTPSGYRKYSRADVQRLRFVLTAQRDQYLPLRVIREQLADGGDDLVEAAGRPNLVALGPDDAPPPSTPSVVAPPHPRDAASVRLTTAELCDRSGLTTGQLRDLEQHGLLTPDAGGRYDADALAVAEVAAAFAEHGVQARHLRAWRAAADREVGLIAALVAPLLRHPDPSAQARAAETVRELTVLSQRLHAALVRVGLRTTPGQ
ncbi:MAG: MerR family transcriptional regulator [Hamadaea sp.]|nr:MerR family transcriptional regulator [Hamadaea sp.]NUR48685.1 MerR family transcriptional regulator [Hamadaea sp.]NUT07540.1 MerR family transcriptional regulator [Hamadaea sp.]